MNTSESTVSSQRWFTRDVREEDFAVLAPLFQQVFGTPLLESMWRWKYLAGRGYAKFVCTHDGEDVVGHYGGWSRAVLLAGKAGYALQPMDVLVRRDQRGVLTRNGPMALGARALFEDQVGEGRKHVFVFGYPMDRAAKLGRKLGLYFDGGEVLELRWPCHMMRPDWRVRVREMNDWPGQHFDAAANAAWQAMAADFAQDALGVRDAQWLRYRYLEHPLNRYHLLAVQNRLGGGVRGIAVLRAREGGEFELLDLIGARRAFPLLVRAARRFAATQGGTTLFGWFARNNSTGLEKTQAAQAHTPDMRQTFAACREPLLSELRRILWFSSGDMDFR